MQVYCNYITQTPNGFYDNQILKEDGSVGCMGGTMLGTINPTNLKFGSQIWTVLPFCNVCMHEEKIFLNSLWG